MNKSEGPDFSSIQFTKNLPISFAQLFSIKTQNDYSIIQIKGEKPIIIIEENAQIPSNIPSNYTILKKPLDKTYLVSSSVMDFLIKLNALDNIKFSGTKKENWYLSEAQDAMENGNILYAGKYSAPDYELLYNNKTNLSIQNTMIYHKPEVKEKLEQLGIPVIVEKSSYEKNPLGKIEWIKLYGLLFDKKTEAEKFFNSKINEFNELKKSNFTNQSCAFFYVTSSGAISVRKNGDYIAKAIEMSGGKYFLEGQSSEEENALSSLLMQSENFYINAKNVDVLIYNSTIDGFMADKNILLKKYPLIKDFKAFKSGKIYCTGNTFFQETTNIVDFMSDLNKIFTGEEDSLKYLIKIK